MKDLILFGEQQLEIPDHTHVITSSWYPDIKAVKNSGQVVAEAVKNPVDSSRFSELAKGASNVTIIFGKEEPMISTGKYQRLRLKRLFFKWENEQFIVENRSQRVA